MSVGPIVSGGRPFLEALVFVLGVALLGISMVPELSSMVVSKFPWLAPILDWLRQMLDRRNHRPDGAAFVSVVLPSFFTQCVILGKGGSQLG